MDHLTACEIADVELRHAQTGNPNAKGLSGIGAWYDPTGAISWWNEKVCYAAGWWAKPDRVARTEEGITGERVRTSEAIASGAATAKQLPAFIPQSADPDNSQPVGIDATVQAVEPAPPTRQLPTISARQAPGKTIQMITLTPGMPAGAEAAFKDCVIQNPFSEAGAQACFSAWIKAHTPAGRKPAIPPGQPQPGASDRSRPFVMPQWAPYAALGSLSFILLMSMAMRR